jgi:hypothetical protein
MMMTDSGRFDPSRGWPSDGSPLNFERIGDPIIKAIRFAYRLERQNGRRSIPWNGPEIGWQERACCPTIAERFKAGNLAYVEDDQGRDALVEIVSAAIQLGIEQGRRLAKSSTSDLLDNAYGSVFTLKVGHDSTQLHLQSGFLADPVTSLERAIEALQDEQRRLKGCPQYRRHAIAMEARQGGDGTAPSRSDDSAARRDRTTHLTTQKGSDNA